MLEKKYIPFDFVCPCVEENLVRLLAFWITFNKVRVLCCLRSLGTTTRVALEAIAEVLLLTANSEARSSVETIAAKVVNVFPRPMSSANMPPLKSFAFLLFAPVMACW